MKIKRTNLNLTCRTKNILQKNLARFQETDEAFLVFQISNFRFQCIRLNLESGIWNLKFGIWNSISIHNSTNPTHRFAQTFRLASVSNPADARHSRN